MVKKINKAAISARLQDKFSLSNTDQSDQPFHLHSDVQPVTSVDDFLLSVQASSNSGTATTRTDTYTVPNGKLWRVKLISAARAQAQTITVYINTPAAAQIDLRLGATSDTEFYYGYELTLSAGWSIVVSFGAGTSGVLRSSVLYEEYPVA